MIELNRNQSKWLVELIELNWIDRSDNRSDRSDNRIQSKIHMFSWLIDFDWVQLVRPISSIEFDWFYRLLRLSLTGFTFDIHNFQFSFSAWGLNPEWKCRDRLIVYLSVWLFLHLWVPVTNLSRNRTKHGFWFHRKHESAIHAYNISFGCSFWNNHQISPIKLYFEEITDRSMKNTIRNASSDIV